MARLSLAIGFVVLLAAAAGGADWPQFRGPAGDGKSSEKGLPTTWSATENVVWKTPLPGPGSSSPIFVGDRIYLTAYRGFNVPGQGGGEMSSLERLVLALDRKSGKVLWTTPVPSKLPEQERIRDDHGYASSTPVSDGQRIYAFFGKSGAVALNLDGKVLWQTPVGETLHGWGTAASPVLHGNLLIVNASVESESLVGLDKNTGKEVWRTPRILEAWNTPVIVNSPAGKPELLVAINGSVLGLDPASGAELWSCKSNIRAYMVPSLVVDRGVAYCVGGRPSAGLAVKLGGRGDVTDSHRLWTASKGSIVSSPVVQGDYLYWAHEALGIVYCAELATGNIIYEERLPRAGQFYSSPLLADGKIYYLTRNGKTFVVAAKPQFELLATNDLGERATFNACPVAADGRLFLRSDKTLYCLDGS